MNVLVTGGFGYIGSILTRELIKYGYNVTVLDNLMYSQSVNLDLFGKEYSNKFNFINGDVRDFDLLNKLVDKNDFVIPLAAIVGFPACEKDKSLATRVNLDQICNICTIHNKKVIYPNTNSGYGLGQGESECTEESPLSPISHYGRTKCEAEKYVINTGGISLRLATVFGVSPRMRLDLLVNDFVYKAHKDGYIVLFEKDFKRNYIHVNDVAWAFCYVMKKFDELKGNVFNVGLSSANLSKHELALKIKEYYPNFSIQIDEINTDPDKRDYVVSNKKIESIGWSPKYTLDDGIQELKNAYKLISSCDKNYRNY